ncbi:MAG: N-acetylmuramoyl-L-alanine amidase [Paludibacteraceae bacterium]|nr:N-acetylmuramoyl-L-alanine amidase [Paludibacteraceae bacterium]
MKKTLLLLLICITTASFAANKRVYINPGHGSWCANCRPMATIPYPNLSSTGMPDTLGFYESNTNLWKGLYLRDKLQEAGGYTVIMSRTANGPAGSTSTANNQYNKKLSEICEEVEANNIDYFISIHSNAASEGTSTNYPIILYRGTDATERVTGSKARANASWDRLVEINKCGFEYYTSYSNSRNVRGVTSFYGSDKLGVLKHSAPGFLSEGYFHTYQPSRHRALNPDWCCQEGLRYFRGIVDYFGTAKDTKGYIMGAVRTKEKSINHSLYTYNSSTNDKYAPIHGAKVVLRNASGEVIKTECYHYVKRMLKDQDYYITDNNYNGIFVFENLTPGQYTLTVHAQGYKDYTQNVTVTANTTTYPQIFLESGQGTEPNINVDIKWVLNGGIILGGDVPTNEELWATFKPYYNTYYGLNRSDQTIENVATFANAKMQDIMTNTKSEYKWLGDYVLSVANAQGKTLDTESAWRWHVHAFFNCNDGTVQGNQLVATADFSQAGKPEAWGEAYQIAMGTSATLPSSVKATYTLPTPKKEGDVFVGWYDNPRGDGTSMTSIPAGYKGTIYAIWQYSNPDSDKEIYIVTWVLNGGIIPGGEVPSNDDLMASFKDGYNTYFSQSIATTREISNFLYYGNTQGCDISQMLTDTKSGWLWLGNYLQEVSSAAGLPISAEVNWRYSTTAFFTCAAAATYNADFTQAGKPEAWGDAYRLAHGLSGELPTVIESPYTIPTPIRTGYIFVGWYDNPDGTGTALTVLPKGYYGTVYAIWKNELETAVENIATPLDFNAPCYDLLGRPVDHTYRGIIIQNGNTYLLK